MGNIYIALIGFVGVVIGAGISAFVTWLVGKQTLKLEKSKQRVEFLMYKAQELNKTIELLKPVSMLTNFDALLPIYRNIQNYLTEIQRSEIKKIQNDIFTFRESLDPIQFGMDIDDLCNKYYNLINNSLINSLNNTIKEIDSITSGK